MSVGEMVSTGQISGISANCQNKLCKRHLGVLHLPAVGAKVALGCGACGHISSFEVVAGGVAVSVSSEPRADVMLQPPLTQFAPGRPRR
jgi:hypothetical protein